MLEVRRPSNASLDAKGRLALPAVVRKALDAANIEELVFAPHEESIWVWAPADFKRLENEVAGADQFDESVQDFVHGFLAMAEQSRIDGAGRVRISADLRDLVGLHKEVKILSVLDRLEIWDRDVWMDRYKAARARAPRRTPGRRSAGEDS